jgi:hypothetical protein
MQCKDVHTFRSFPVQSGSQLAAVRHTCAVPAELHMDGPAAQCLHCLQAQAQHSSNVPTTKLSVRYCNAELLLLSSREADAVGCRAEHEAGGSASARSAGLGPTVSLAAQHAHDLTCTAGSCRANCWPPLRLKKRQHRPCAGTGMQIRVGSRRSFDPACYLR